MSDILHGMFLILVAFVFIGLGSFALLFTQLPWLAATDAVLALALLFLGCALVLTRPEPKETW